MPSPSLLLRQRYFPKEIILITINYIGSHFVIHRTSYQWNIDKDTLNDMQTADQQEQFTSPTINIAKLKWELHAYPNGSDENSVGSFDLFLALISMAYKWKKIIACINFQCPEIHGAQYIGMVSFQQDEKSIGWSNDTLTFTEVQSLLSFTITVQMQIIRIVFTENDQTIYNYLSTPWSSSISQIFTWNIDADLLRHMKHVADGKAFISNIYYNMWCIVIYPNGGEIELRLCALPKDTEKIAINWELCLDDLKKIDSWYNIFDEETNSWTAEDIISKQRLDTLDSLSITIKINFASEDDRIAHMIWCDWAEQNEKVLKMLQFDEERLKQSDNDEMLMQHQQNKVENMQGLQKMNETFDVVLQKRDILFMVFGFFCCLVFFNIGEWK